MNIAVCIKQVPDVDDIKWTKENNLDRREMLSKMNPYDEWALDFALKFKDKFKDVNITAISMGPEQARDVLYQAVAKGANRAILLSDKLFQGSDTLVTARILSTAIRKYVSNFDVIITGQLAPDGDTAQTPVSIARFLSINDVENVVDIINADKNQVLLTQKLNDETNMIEVKTPCLVAVEAPCPIKTEPKIDDYIRAQDFTLEIYGSDDLGLNRSDIGIVGSPTMVHRAFKNEINKDTVEIKDDVTKKLLDFILKI